MGKLTDAVWKGDLEEVKRLLAGEYKIGFFNNKINSEEDNVANALCCAAISGHVPIIQELIRGGAIVDYQITYKQPWKEYLDGRSFNEHESTTALSGAARNGQVEAMRVLLKAGALVDKPGGAFNHTPLIDAVYTQDKNFKARADEVIGTLVQAGANPDYFPLDRNGRPDYYYPSALFVAAKKGDPSVIRALLKHKANVNYEFSMEVKRLADRYDVSIVPDSGHTALHEAIEAKKADAVRALLEGGARTDIRCHRHGTALEYARKYSDEMRNILEIHLGIKPKPVVKVPAQAPVQVPFAEEQKNFAEALAAQAPLHPVAFNQVLEGIKVTFSIEQDELVLGKQLGAGGFGVVYLGKWKKHTDVAIKQIHNIQFSQDMLAEFRHEIEVMANLRSPYIVQFYGACFKAPYCIVMEYMPKGSLFHVLHSADPLPWPSREQIALDIACGLSFLHGRNIIHRDLKSLNVLLDAQYRAKLSDFGLAKVRTQTSIVSRASHKQAVGTLAWMAPELFDFDNKTGCTKESDIYSYAMTIFELASREFPFQNIPNEQLIPLWVGQGRRPAIPPDVPRKITNLITFAWDARAVKRPNADQVVEFLKSGRPDFH